MRTNIGGGVEKPTSGQDPSPSALISSTADNLTLMPGEAGPPRADTQHQQKPIRDIPSMEMNNTTDASHSTKEQPTRSDALQALVGSSKRGRDPHKSIDERNVMDGCDPASPYQGREESFTGEKHAMPGTLVHTLRSDTSEKLANGAASSPEGHKRHKWKRTFHMVIHLVNDNNATRVTCLDTGADIDVISMDVVDSLHLARKRYQGPALKPIGDTYLPEWQVTFDWHVANRTKTYTSTFAVLDKNHSKDFDILLGKDSVEEIKFYEVNPKVWLQVADDEHELAADNDGMMPELPSIVVEK